MTKPAPSAIIAGAAAMWDSRNASNIAARALETLAKHGYVIVQAPSVAFKGPHDTDQSMLRNAAQRAEDAKYIVGGSNVGRAVGQVLRDVADQMDRRHTASFAAGS